MLELASKKKVLFCGESITDTYHYVRPLGRPTKDAIVSVELHETEKFAGGVLAAANHAKAFSKVETYVGGCKTVKTRFVESMHNRKLFEYYVYGGNGHDPMPKLDNYDAVIVLDYGHGMAEEKFIDGLSASKYLAINVQTNSGNYGFNLATKYRYADYLCVDEPEARLATQNRHGPLESSMLELSNMAEKVVITMGKNGAVGKQNGHEIVYCAAFTDTVVDTMGAGDAFFAITALVAEQ